MPESENQLSWVLLKLATSLESRDELRGCFLRRKNDRRADVLPRRVVPSPSVISLRRRSSSSTLKMQAEIQNKNLNLKIKSIYISYFNWLGIMPHSNRWPYSSSFQARHCPNTPRKIVVSTYNTSSLVKRNSPSPKSPVRSKPTRIYNESPASSLIWLNSKD